MKLLKKYLFPILSLIVIISALTLTATAANEETPDSNYCYSLYNPKTGVITYHSSANSLGELLTKKIDGAVITLLKDVTVTSKATYAGSQSFGTSDNKNDIYLDLNGKKLLHAYSSYFTFIEIYQNTNLNVYSSKEGGAILSTVPTATGHSAYTLFNLRYSGAHLSLGEVNAPIIELDNNKDSSTYGKYIETGRRTYSGDNLSTYSAQLVTTYYGTVEDNQHKDLSVEVIGGDHYKTHSAREGMFILENDVTINIERARIHALSNSSALIFTHSHILNFADISFTDCEIYTPAILKVSSTKFKASFKNCYIACPEVPESGSTVQYSDSYFTSPNVRTSSTMIKGVNDVKRVNRKTVSYNYSSGSINTAEPYTFTEDSTEYLFCCMIIDDPTASPDKYAKIDWVAKDKTVTEYWLRDEGVIPTPPIPETYASVAAYSFVPGIVSTLESGNATYTLTPHINFTIKANLALYSDFVYNLYIPRSAADSDDFISARIDKYGDGGSILRGEELSVKGGETVSIKITEDYYEEYYVLRKSILATEGDAEFRLVLTINGAFGDIFTHTQNFSIFDYANRVKEGNYAENAKTMVESTVTYIKAARNYSEFVKAPDAPLPYPLPENPDLEAVSGTAVATPRAPLSEEMTAVFYGMTLSLKESINFRFYLYPSVTDTVKLTYRTNTKPTERTITAADCEKTSIGGTALLCYDITMRSIDLRSPIEIDLLSTGDGIDYTYRLANYVHSVKGSSDAIDNLMDAMFAYSIATNTYLRGETSDAPSVDISIQGKEITADSYVIVANAEEEAAASALRLAILAKTNEELRIVREVIDGKNSIFFEKVAPTLEYDLRVAVSGFDLSISYGLTSFLENGVSSFIEEYIRPISVNNSFNARFSDSYGSNVLYYSDFGAAGDGITDDFKYLYEAHVFANQTGKTVKADSGATYYIHNTNISANGSATAVRTIPIMTDTDWGDAHIIIDDSDIDCRKSVDKTMSQENIFTVISKYPKLTLSASDERVAALKNIGASYGTSKIDLGLGYPALITITNSAHKVYRRSGSSYFNASTGSVQSSNQEEILLIDAEGNIDPSTGFMFDYPSLTSVTVMRCDEGPLTVKGGTVTTLACAIDAEYTVTNSSGSTSVGRFGYFARGLLVNRSFTVIENVKHHIEGEITPEEHSLYDKQGAHYSGFFYAENANDVLFKDCVLQGRRYYGLSGTYDFGAKRVNKITLDGCIQRNFWLDENDAPSDVDTGITSMKNDVITVNGVSKSVRHCWGIGGTNFCKNMNYWNSRLSRFDAHCGLYNGSVINCEVTFFSLIGKGDFLIKDTTWYAASTSQTDNYLIYLRGDYGSTWNGNLTIENLKAYTLSTSAFKMFFHSYKNWDYGYKCYFPSVEINGFELYKMTELPENRTIIPAGTKIPFMNFSSEYNLHLETTLRTAPTRVFKNEDGTYSQTTNKAVTGLVNDNPIVPPEYIRILNNKMNYDFTYSLENYMKSSTFFNGTRISIGTKTGDVITETKVINKGNG